MSSVLDTPKNSAVAEASSDTPTKEATAVDIKAAIVRQVEFYFSDANLPTDKFLLKQVQQGHQGFVPIKLIAQFKRVKSLSKDVDVITDALKGSADLVVSPDNLYVRRLKPLPNVNEHDIKKRTVLATQIPGIPSIESVTDLFSRYGAVKLVRICPPGSTEKLPQWLTVANPSVQAAAASNQLFALVELVTEDAARRAVADSGSSGMQVRHLLFDQQQPRGPHHHPQQQQQPQPPPPQQQQQDPQQQQQQQQQTNGAGRGNPRRNRGGLQPGEGPPGVDMLHSDMARMQLRSIPGGPLPFQMDALGPHHAPHYAPQHHPHPHAHAFRGPGAPTLHDHRRANQRQAPYSHDARMRTLHTAEAGPSYHHHQPHHHHAHGPPAPLDISAAGPPRAPPANAPPQRVLLVRPQHAPYHTPGPGLAPNGTFQPTPPAQQTPQRNADQAPGRVRDRPASDRPHANAANDKADRGGGANPDRPVSVGRRAPHFVVDLDYQPAESGRRAPSRRQRGRNPMDNPSGSSGDTSAASSPMAGAGGGNGAGLAAAPVPDRKPPQQQQPLQAAAQHQQQQTLPHQQGRGKNGRQGGANNNNGVGGPGPLRHGGQNPLFTSPVATGHGQPHPAIMQHAAAQLHGLQTQANGQDLRQFIALFESFVQQQLGSAPAGASAAAPGAAPAVPPVGSMPGGGANNGGAPPASPVQHRAPTYVPIPQPATPPASLPGVAAAGGKQQGGKKGKNKAGKGPLPDGSTPEQPQGGASQRPLTPPNGAATPPPGGNPRPQGQQQQQQQGRKNKGTPAQQGGGRGGGKGGAAGQEGGPPQENSGAGSGGEGSGNSSSANGGEGFGKKRTKKDYAAWAAATAEFRAQSSAMYAGANGGAAPEGGATGAAPAVGTPPQAPAPIKEVAAAVKGPRIPDGTRGFGMGRGRPMAPPVV